MKVNLQPAYLLHTRPFSESSLLLDMFTKEHGRLMLLAKGARRSNSRLRGVLFPFKLLLISWAGKGSLPVLTAAEQSGFSADMSRMTFISGFYMNELLLYLLHRHDAHEALFEHYHHVIQQLGNEDTLLLTLRIFEKKLLQNIGFAVVLDRDAETGEAISTDRQYYYVLEKGPVCIDSPTQPDSQSREPMLIIHGNTLCALHKEKFQSNHELREARRLNSSLIDHQLHGRKLHSRRVMREMNRYFMNKS